MMPLHNLKGIYNGFLVLYAMNIEWIRLKKSIIENDLFGQDKKNRFYNSISFGPVAKGNATVGCFYFGNWTCFYLKLI